MRKFNLWFALLALITLGIGSYVSPYEGIFWLASPDLGAQIIRGSLAILIIIQLITEPPRHMLIRAITGLVSIATAMWAVYTTTMMSTPLFDTILYIQAAIALGITALELPTDEPQIISDTPLIAK